MPPHSILAGTLARAALRVSVALAALGAVALAPAAASAADVLPPHGAPPQMRSIDSAAGGRILEGVLDRSVTPATAYRAALRRLRGYFDGSPTLDGVSQSKDGALTVGSFHGTLSGVAVRGIVLASYQPGASRATVVFDRSERFAGTLKPMLRELAAAPAAAPAAAAPPASGAQANFAEAVRAVQLRTMESPDRTVRAGVPAGWSIKLLQHAVFIATGPDGAEVDRGLHFTFSDPRGAQIQMMRRMGMPITTPVLPYTSDPVQALTQTMRFLALQSHHPAPSFHIMSTKRLSNTATMVQGTQTQGGKTYAFVTIVAPYPPSPAGDFTTFFDTESAPTATFTRDLAPLAAVSASYTVDSAVFRQVLDNDNAANAARANAYASQSIARIHAIGAASMRAARASQDAIDRSTAGYVRYLGGTDVVQYGNSGPHYQVSTGPGVSLAPGYRSVPITQYVKGVDY